MNRSGLYPSFTFLRKVDFPGYVFLMRCLDLRQRLLSMIWDE
jgi:hypothetical protein